MGFVGATVPPPDTTTTNEPDPMEMMMEESNLTPEELERLENLMMTETITFGS